MALKITLKKSLIGYKQNQIDTAKTFGLSRPGDRSVQPDNAATQGKIRVISHLVEVEEVKEVRKK